MWTGIMKEFHYQSKKHCLDLGHDMAEESPKGQLLTGVVKRLVSYGAFVEVFPGVEGLVHISQISHKHIGTPHEVLKEGKKCK